MSSFIAESTLCFSGPSVLSYLDDPQSVKQSYLEPESVVGVGYTFIDWDRNGYFYYDLFLKQDEEILDLGKLETSIQKRKELKVMPNKVCAMTCEMFGWTKRVFGFQ